MTTFRSRLRSYEECPHCGRPMVDGACWAHHYRTPRERRYRLAVRLRWALPLAVVLWALRPDL